MDQEKITGLTKEKGRKRYAFNTFYILNYSLISYIALFSLHHHKFTNLIVGGSLAGTTPVSRIFVLQVINQKEEDQSEQVIPDVIIHILLC